jgi:phosphoglucosamine mutase
MARMFGTDGVRGVVGVDLTARMAFELGRAGASVLTEGTHHPRILVGRDTRISGEMLQCSLIAGICAVGGQALDVGVMTTPGIAYLTRLMGADAGVVISASHNPMEFNGIKFFNREGFKLPDAVEDEIEAVVRGDKPGLPAATGADIGVPCVVEQAEQQYLNHLVSRVDQDLSSLRVVVDCANGASSRLAPQLLRSLGVDVVAMHDRPDGTNINLDCGSTHMGSLQQAVVAQRAHLGLAFDGDADRMLAVDELGHVVDGDQIMLICARALKAAGKLADDTLVVTVMSNLGLTLAAKELGVKLETTAVGDRYVLERMLEKGYVLGGEQSGHIIMLEDNTTGDGMASALRLMGAMVSSGQPLSQLAAIMTVLPQVLVNITVDNAKKNAWEQDEEIQAALREKEAHYAGRGRILVRASGTEPLVRVMIEGEEQATIERDARELADLIAGRIG